MKSLKFYIISFCVISCLVVLIQCIGTRKNNEACLDDSECLSSMCHRKKRNCTPRKCMRDVDCLSSDQVCKRMGGAFGIFNALFKSECVPKLGWSSII
jgi:hypothetical protein